MVFTGFSQETRDFFWGLLTNNERPWFEAHREEYRKYLLEPFKELALDTSELMAARCPELGLNLHVARIYRDARRLFGRGPYKEHLWFSLGRTTGMNFTPAFWFEIGPEGYTYGAGCYGASAQQMEEYRKSIEANPAAFERMVSVIEADGRFALSGEDYKRMKKDMGTLNPWYNKKCFSYERVLDFEGDLLTPELPQVLTDGFALLAPLYDWVRQSFALENDGERQ